MTWYLILLVISACVLIGQTVLSFIGGEIDVDMDADLDSSDMLSFKGIVHFVFGFSLTLTTMGGVSVLSTFVAVLVGLLFTVILFYIYKHLRQEIIYQDEIKDTPAQVYYWDSELNKGEIGKIEAEKTVTNKNAELEVVRADAEKAANTARVKADAEAEVVRQKGLAQAEAEKASLKA